MHLLLVVILSLISSDVDGKPQFFRLKESPEEAKEALTRFFSPSSEKIDLPPVQKSPVLPGNHPYGFNLTNDGSGNYYFGYKVFFGSERYEIGELKNAGTDNEIQSVRGQYIDRVVAQDGTTIVRTIGYTADEKGYRPFLIDAVTEGPVMGGGFGTTEAVGKPQKPPQPGIGSHCLGSLIGCNGR